MMRAIHWPTWCSFVRRQELQRDELSELEIRRPRTKSSRHEPDLVRSSRGAMEENSPRRLQLLIQLADEPIGGHRRRARDFQIEVGRGFGGDDVFLRLVLSH